MLRIPLYMSFLSVDNLYVVRSPILGCSSFSLVEWYLRYLNIGWTYLYCFDTNYLLFLRTFLILLYGRGY